jgi:MoaA/NifB/PqqE/SkfB family radical SAM enzyme
MITDHIDAVTRIPETHRHEITPAPISVKVELSAKCDLRCKFCATRNNLRGKGMMDFALLDRLLREMKEIGVEEIGLFFLGESLLYPRLVDAIKLAKDIGFKYVFLTTNGRMLTRTLAYDIMSAGLDSLKFSLNEAEKEKYKDTTGVDCFDTVVQNIKDAVYIRDRVAATHGHRCGVYVSSILYDENQKILVKPIIDSLGNIDEHYWLPLYNQGGYTKGNKRSSGNPGRVGALRDPLPCWTLFAEGHITWDGILTGCSFSHGRGWDYGDLNKITFMDAWNSETAQGLRRANLKKDITGTACEKCILNI